MTHRRSTCGKWKLVGGRRLTCNYKRGHDGDCKPDKALRERRMVELGRLLLEHGDAECAGCVAYVAAVNGGMPTPEALLLRCEWAAGLHAELWPDDVRPAGAP